MSSDSDAGKEAYAEPQLILASGSRYRRELLEQLGVAFQTVSPRVDESAIQERTDLSPQQVAEQLAYWKAAAVSEQFPDAVVIGSDQVATIDGRILQKPETRERTITQIRELSGRTHFLLAAVCVKQGREERQFCVEARMAMKPLSQAAIEAYVDQDQAFDCVGGYRWESAGERLFESVETSDPTAIIGLPLEELTPVLEGFGIRVPG
ncbi:Maf family protein [Rubinisphaera margarita]|uniref:Maf family protein n=1 Tax=Rubinisphaera margarita TaxID=2909586 RepID=UPI001EE98E37|nr:nucleoside triphosphate pyrophosphatase [Rubinisphaera margarita]MCG6155987.1 Maf family protein [Rubinisphaera margarita]